MALVFDKRSIQLDRETIYIVLLLLFDTFFLVMHLLRATNVLSLSKAWSIQEDVGFGEIFQYVKFLFLLSTSFYLVKKVRSPIHASFGLLFTIALADDLFLIHEGWGDMIARFMNLPDYLGEIFYWGLIGLIPMVALLFSYLNIENVFDKVYTREMIVLIIVLAAASIGLDFLAEVIKRAPSNISDHYRIVGRLEDFLEMVILSIIVWYQLRFLRVRRNSYAD